MVEVTNLANLRNLSITTNTVYVKGYNHSGDGGGGIFLWRTEESFQTGEYSSENFGTIIKSNIVPNENGSWIRQYEGFINVVYFGAFGTGNLYNAEIQRAIDFASLNSKYNPKLKGSTIYIANGSYVLNKIILKNGVSIIGDSISKTLIYSHNGEATEYLFEIEEGPVTLNISNLHLVGNDTQKGCFRFKALSSKTAPFHGGLWESRISNIKISGFKGHGIFLDGGGSNSDYLLPNQFNIFENVRVKKGRDFSNALKISGQNAQASFINCRFDGFLEVNEEGVIINASRGHNINIKNNGKYKSAVISFINCTSQNADYGIYIEWAENITIDNCWFENLGVAITVKSNLINPNLEALSKSINILNNRFANAAGFGSLHAPNNITKGHCILVNKSFVNVFNNYVTVSNPNGQYLDESSTFLMAADNTTGGVNIANNNFQALKLGRTFGVIQVINIVGNTIECYNHKEIFVNGSSSPVTTIKSSINASEFLVIRVNGDSIMFKNTDNIFFRTSNQGVSFTISNGEIATFIKADNMVGSNYENYQLISIQKILP